MTAIDKPKYREAQWEFRLYYDNPEPQPLLYAPHVCTVPEKWSSRDRAYTDNEGGHPYPDRPRYPEHAIWQCPECRRYYHYLERSDLMHEARYWLPVRWWNRTARRHIREALNG